MTLLAAMREGREDDASDAEHMAQPVEARPQDVLHHLRRHEIREHEAEEGAVEQHQPVFSAHAAARLLDMVEPVLYYGYLLARQLARDLDVLSDLLNLAGNVRLLSPSERCVRKLLLLKEKCLALAKLSPQVRRIRVLLGQLW